MTLRCSSRRSGRPSRRGRFFSDPVADGLGGPADPQQRGVGGHDHRAEPGEEDEADGPDPGGVRQARGDRCAERTTGRTKTGRASSPPMPRKEKAVRPLTDSVGVHPGGAQHPELDGGAGRRAARHDERDGVARQLGGDDREPRLGAQGDPLQRERAGEVDPLGQHGGDEPQEVERGELGPRVQHRQDAGRHQVEDHPGEGDGDGPPDQCLPPDRPLLLLLELALERARVGVLGQPGDRRRVVAVPATRSPRPLSRALSLRPGPSRRP